MFVIPPHFPWNSYSVKSAVAPNYYPKDNFLCDKIEKKRFIHVNPRTYMQINTPTVAQGGWMDPPRVFDMLQYFETILPSEQSLWTSLQDEVCFIGGGTAGGPVMSSTMVPILGAILDFTKNKKSG